MRPHEAHKLALSTQVNVALHPDSAGKPHRIVTAVQVLNQVFGLLDCEIRISAGALINGIVAARTDKAGVSAYDSAQWLGDTDDGFNVHVEHLIL